MSVSAYITRTGFPDVVVPIVGNNELLKLWLPIVQFHQCVYFEHAFSAGLSLNSENYNDVLEESFKLLSGLKLQQGFEYDIVNPAFRCERMIQLIKDNPPGSGSSVYIG